MKPREILEALKILYLSHDSGIPYWGTKGASIHVREFTKALRAAGHQVQIAIARTGQGPNGDDGMCCLPDVADPFFELGGTQKGSSLLSEAKSFARSFVSWTPPCSDFELVYERYSLFGVAGLSLARQRGVPFVLEVNSPLVKEAKQYRTLSLEPLARTIEEYLFSQADCILAVSTAVESHIREVSPGAKVLVLPNGVDVQPFLTALPSKVMQQRLKGKFSVGFVGSLKPWHGLETLLQAFQLISEDPEFHLVCVGDGPLLPNLTHEAERLNLKEGVTFTGGVDHQEIPGILKSMDVLCSPYPDIEDFYFSPLKIFEYMAAGRPIVASRIGQIADLLTEGKDALLVPPGDPVALSHAIRKLKSDRTLGERLGRAAQQEVKDQHTWATRVKTIEPIFLALSKKAPGHFRLNPAEPNNQ